MNKPITILIILTIIALLLLSISLGIKYYLLQKESQKIFEIAKINNSIVIFDKLFVDKVLRTQGEVSLEDRLQLENAVWATNDKDIIDAWNYFLESSTEQEAQQRVLTILGLFADKLASF